MRPRSDWLHTLAALTLAGLMACVQAQDSKAQDAALEAAIELQAQGRAWQAQAQLLQMAEAGHLVAMERLALLHWYGPLFYPDQAWSRELASTWFERAAARGSDVGRHMVQVARATASTKPRASR